MARPSVPTLFLAGAALALALPAAAIAAETCGNAADDDADGLADDGCYPTGMHGLCISPVSCGLSGAVGPESGAVVWHDGPDHMPRLPYGPSLDFRRVYTSQYLPPLGYFPGTGASNFTHGMGIRWQHQWMGWVRKIGTRDKAVVHLPTGEDVQFTFTSFSGSIDTYAAQAGRHYQYLNLDTQTGYWELKDLQGFVYAYQTTDPDTTNFADYRKLTSIKDRIPNTVSVTYNANGQVDRVTAAGGEKYLQFTYNTDTKKLLNRVRLNTTAGTGTTYDVDFAYNATYPGNLSTVTRGVDLVETITVDSSDLVTNIASDGKTVVDFRYDSSNRLRTSESKEGAVGYGYGDTLCDTTGNYVYFNRANSTLCNTDADCGTDAFCGGKTGAGSTGYCFFARQCVRFTTTKEHLPTDITATKRVSSNPVTCNSCLTTNHYEWNATSLDLEGTQSADNVKTSHEYDTNGMRKTTVEDDSDYVASNGGQTGSRITYTLYQDSRYPGRVTETRRQSELDGGLCNAIQSGGCKRTITTYVPDSPPNSGTGQVDTVQEIGFTYGVSGTTYAKTSYTYTSDWDYDSLGRPTLFKGPRSAPVTDNVEYTYYTTAGQQKDYPELVKRQIGTTTYLTTTFAEYDGTGFAGRESDPNDTTKCRKWNSTQHRIASERQVVDGTWNDCSAVPGANDEKVTWNYDKHGRLIETQKPRSNCTTRSYDSLGRLSVITQRDATCVTAGNTINYTYNSDGEVTKIEWKTDAGTVKRTQEYSYYADRRRKNVVNPVDPAKQKEILYDDDGVLAEVQDETIGSTTDTTQYDVDRLNRLDAVRRGTTASTKTWDVVPGVQLDLPTRVSDPILPTPKNVDAVWDDLGRKVKEVTPNTGGPTYFVYDEAGNLVEKGEADGHADEKTTIYTYEWQNRLTGVNLADASCGGEQTDPEIKYVYDSNSAENCPTGSNCQRLWGRLAYVKTKMWCATAELDDTFDQRTWYSYTQAGRIEEHTIKRDDSATNTYRVTYTYDKNGNPTRINPPSGSTGGTVYVYDGGVDASNADLVTSISRDTTQIVSGIKYLPFGPWTEYIQANGFYHPAGGTFFAIKVTATLNQAYRYTQIKAASTYSTPDNITQMDLAEDPKGRYTKRDLTYTELNEKDMWFMYDSFDRLCCRTKNAQTCHTASPPSCVCSNCPSTGNPLENVSYDDAGDRTKHIHDNASSPPLTTYTTNYVTGTNRIQCLRKDAAADCNANYRIAFAWDGRGNRTSDDDNEFSGSNDDIRTYTYDAKNRVSTETRLDLSGNGNTHVLSFAYDEQDRLIFASDCNTTTDPGCSAAETNYLHYDQWGRVIEVIKNNDPDAHKNRQHYWLGAYPVFSHHITGPVWRQFRHGDEQGRPYKRTTWPSTGDATVDWSTEMGAWGWDAPGDPITDQPFRFPGHLCYQQTRTHGTGGQKRPTLCWERGRVYDPFTGTYLQELQDKGGAFSGPTRAAAENRGYVFADDNPIGISGPGYQYLEQDDPYYHYGGGLSCPGAADPVPPLPPLTDQASATNLGCVLTAQAFGKPGDGFVRCMKTGSCKGGPGVAPDPIHCVAGNSGDGQVCQLHMKTQSYGFDHCWYEQGKGCEWKSDDPVTAAAKKCNASWIDGSMIYLGD